MESSEDLNCLKKRKTVGSATIVPMDSAETLTKYVTGLDKYTECEIVPNDFHKSREKGALIKLQKNMKCRSLQFFLHVTTFYLSRTISSLELSFIKS